MALALGSSSVADPSCPSGSAYAGTFDPKTNKPYCVPVASTGPLLGGVFEDSACTSGYRVAGTFDPSTGKPYCASQSMVDSMNVKTNTVGTNVIVPDAKCATGFHIAGTFDASTKAPFCATAQQVASMNSNTEVSNKGLLGGTYQGAGVGSTGGLVQDSTCATGYHISGSSDPKTGKPFCATIDQVSAVQTVASLIDNIDINSILGGGSASSANLGGLMADPSCPSGYHIHGTSDPKRGGAARCATKEQADNFKNSVTDGNSAIGSVLDAVSSALKSANLGSLSPDASCSTGYAVGGTYDSKRKGPACATPELLDQMAGAAFSAVAPMLGGLAKDDKCPSGYCKKGTFDPQRGAPACASKQDVDSSVAMLESQISSSGDLSPSQQSIADVLQYGSQGQKNTNQVPHEDAKGEKKSHFAKFAVVTVSMFGVCAVAVVAYRNRERIMALRNGKNAGFTQLQDEEVGGTVTMITY